MQRGDRKLTRHHLFPKSRGEYIGKNTADIDQLLHYAWHTATDKTNPAVAAIPEEVLEDFLDIWWLDEGYTVTVYIGHTIRTFTRRCQRMPNTTNAPSGYEIVFPNNRPLEVVKHWLWRWVPDDYFDRVVFETPQREWIIDPYNVDRELLARIDRQQRSLLDQAHYRWRTFRSWERKGAYQDFLTRI